MPLPPRGDTNRNSTGAGMQRAGAVGAAAPGGSPSGHQPLTPQQQQFLMQQMYMQQQAKFARQNAGAPIIRRRDRNAGVITDEEWEEGVEHVDDRDGKSFRRLLLIMLAIAIVFLAFMKYEAEESFAIHPDMAKLAEREAELRGDVAQAAAKPKAAGSTADTPVTTAAADASSSDSAVTQEQIDEYYKLLNVEPSAQLSEAELRENVRKELQRLKDEATTAEEKAKLDGEDAYLKVLREQDKQRRLDEWRKLQTLKQNFNRHQEEYGQLVACGKQCESQHKQLQLAYDTLNGQVTRELFTTLLDENVLKSGRKSVTNEELKTAFEKKKEQIEASSETEEVKSMELAEIKDAYDVLQNPETRTYYLMFGRKPPEHMKKTSTRHGGWGQELLLRTHKNRLVLAWLDYFAASWADYSVLGIIGFFGFLLPVGMQLPRIIEMAKEIEERQIQMEELEKRAAEADAAGGAK